jgi:hypothetical protein
MALHATEHILCRSHEESHGPKKQMCGEDRDYIKK